jgi:hypothetical protein
MELVIALLGSKLIYMSEKPLSHHTVLIVDILKVTTTLLRLMWVPI